MTILAKAGIALLTAAALAAPAIAATMHHPESGRKLDASLSGGMEVPGPGDSDGTGMFTARVNAGAGQLCYTLTSARIGTATMAHIHSGASGVAGPPVVTLATPLNGRAHACMAIARDLAQTLIQSPDAYYVNVHSSALPSGAIRGQLTK